MPAVYEQFGVRFLYPENWEVLDEETDDWPRTVTLQSRETGFWTLQVYPPNQDARKAVLAVVESIREVYPDLEVLPAKETIADAEAKGVDIAFFYLDLLVEAKIRCVKTPAGVFLWHYQAESRELDTVEPVFRAIATSLLQTQVPIH
ncbi:MAG: hypothetical protein L0211_07460 [Planctomycetaceae bacterium]|nr:hypothetical protein [Planctomycetaceae bacterium]